MSFAMPGYRRWTVRKEFVYAIRSVNERIDRIEACIKISLNIWRMEDYLETYVDSSPSSFWSTFFFQLLNGAVILLCRLPAALPILGLFLCSAPLLATLPAFCLAGALPRLNFSIKNA